MAEDLQPSFLTTLPSTAPLVDVSYYQHREPSLLVSSYRNLISDDFTSHYLSVLASSADKLWPSEYCVDIAMLSEDREVHLLTITLEYMITKKKPFRKMHEKTLGWHITGQGSVSNVCQGHGPLNAILLDVKFEAVVIACHDGVEIICLHPREASPGDKLTGSTRKWISMFEQGPGPILTITESRNEIFLLTKARASAEPIFERIAGLTFKFNPLWNQKSLAWSRPVTSRTADSIPKEVQSITPVNHSDHEYVLWNPALRCVQLVYISTSHTHLRLYMIAQLQDPLWSGELRPPSCLAAVYHHQENIIIASFPVEGEPPRCDEMLHRSTNTPVFTSEKHVREDIYLSQYDATLLAGNIDFYRQSASTPTHAECEPIPQHYVGSITSPYGIQTIKIAIRHAADSRTDILHSQHHQDFHQKSCYDENDHLVVIVFVLKGSNDVVIWYLAKTMRAYLLGGRREMWRWKEQQPSLSTNNSGRAKRGASGWQTLRKVFKREELPEAHGPLAGWVIEKDPQPIRPRHDGMF
ncbi:hypothetical protein MMC26_002594 [Xylographa opegraphella]|nr:hypothetical protein [Xylographa opegraphella]